MTHAATPPQQLADLLATCLDNHSLPGAFYNDPLVYQADLDRIWRRGWLFAGHSCQLAQPGDYITVNIDVDSLIVIRDDDGGLRALHNICRHRGTVLCHEPAGRVGRIVCPYHQWTYGRDGQLLSCRGMQPEIDKSQLGLVPAQVREVAGLVFVSLSDDPPDFEPARELIEPLARPQGMERAKIAAVRDYEIAANWKLVWDNNRECYHCNANHPQYIKANFDHYNADDATDRVREKIAAATARSEAKWAACGLAVTHRETGMAPFPDASSKGDRHGWFSANRTALVDGWVSESMDGRQIAPLMGDYADPDVGTLRIRTMPNFWNHSSCDHAVSTRLLPAGPHKTLAQVTWLVQADAVEGRDYRLEELMPFWQLTSEQDWELCSAAQRGVMSSRYTPGPLSTFKEYNVEAFRKWYVKQLAGV
ncbi:MAG: aromatic ring-hydroxylating dioxygenase subunit alpha [Planctomycetia bacterium]|nr:aromatic ring-hydroxylating dioxygenase subunit alpha [Planctomycetia bacterium]